MHQVFIWVYFMQASFEFAERIKISNIPGLTAHVSAASTSTEKSLSPAVASCQW